MSGSETDKIYDTTVEQRVFMPKEMVLRPKFLGLLREQVPAGKLWMLHCDGRLVRNLHPGPHTWWNGFLHKWTAQEINTRVELVPMRITGRVKGPSAPQDLQGAPPIELACDVTADLELSVKVAEVENFVQHSDPISVFFASIHNIVVEEIGKLQYDQYGEWATMMRGKIRERLQEGGRDNTERRLGMRVEEVFIIKFQPNSHKDRATLRMYELVEQARRELVVVRAQAQRQGIEAQSYAEQGRVINISPSILALRDHPVGKVLIEHDAELRGLMLYAGIAPGGDMAYTTHPSGQLAGPGSGIYLNPPLNNSPISSGSSFTGGLTNQVTGQIWSPSDQPTGPTGQNSWQSTSPLDPSSPSSPLLDVPTLPVDPTRQQSEIAQLQGAGFMVAGKGNVSPRYDEQGSPIANSSEWMLQVSLERSSGPLVMIFHCPAGYPTSPPRVRVRQTTGGFVWLVPNSVKNWNSGRSLFEVAHEINQSMPLF
jgi:hypothetical protein